MPYLYHSFISPKSDAADSTLVRPTNWNARLQYGTSGPAGTDATVREVLTAARTYYVRTDGNDSNNGLTNTAGGAFLTGQHAVDVVLGTLDLGTPGVTIQFAAGTYAENIGINAPMITGVGILYLAGDPAAPSNVLVEGFNCFGPFYVLVDGFTFSGTAGPRLTSWEGYVEYQNCRFAANAGNYNTLTRTNGELVRIGGTEEIVGSAAGHIFVDAGGYLFNRGQTTTLTGSPAFSIAFAVVQQGGAYLAGQTWSGAATGTRYDVTRNGVIDTNGGVLPGDLGGTTATGGQYI